MSQYTLRRQNVTPLGDVTIASANMRHAGTANAVDAEPQGRWGGGGRVLQVGPRSVYADRVALQLVGGQRRLV